jgi:hypothetical protein
MSAREAIIDEIKTAPESLARETYDFILFLKQRRTLEHEGKEPKTVSAKPDFLARQQTLFGSRVINDSQALLDELRADRFQCATSTLCTSLWPWSWEPLSFAHSTCGSPAWPQPLD